MLKKIYSISLFLCILTPYQKSQAFSVGGGLALNFNNFYYASSNSSKEKSSFGSTLITQIKFIPWARLITIPQLDVTYYFNNQWNASIGAHIGVILHPLFQPFIAVNFKGSYYSKIIEQKHQFNFSVGFSMGSQIYKWTNSDLSLLFDYLIYQTNNKVHQSSFSIGLLYHYNLSY